MPTSSTFTCLPPSIKLGLACACPPSLPRVSGVGLLPLPQGACIPPAWLSSRGGGSHALLPWPGLSPDPLAGLLGLPPELFLSVLPPHASAPWGISLCSTPSLVSVPLRMPPRGHCSRLWLSLSFPSPPRPPPPHVSDAFSPGLGLDSFLTPPTPTFFAASPTSAFYPNSSFSLLALCDPSPHPSFSLFSSFLPINNSPLCSHCL